MTEITTTGIINELNNITKVRLDLQSELNKINKTLEDLEIIQERDELSNQIKLLDKQEQLIKEQGKNILLDQGVKKFESLDGTTISLAKKPGKLIINSEEAIPEEYYKRKETLTLDKKALKDDLKEGLIIDGVEIEVDYNLNIKHEVK